LPKARFAGIFGASQGNHVLGSGSTAAGVTFVAGPKVQFDGSQAHDWLPRSNGSMSNPAGWSRYCWMYQFSYTISTGTVGSAHYVFRRGNDTTRNLCIMEKTDRDLEIYLDNTLMLTWTPSAEHHIYITIYNATIGAGGTLAIGEEAWLTIWIDKTLVLNVRHTMSMALNPANGVPFFGETSAISGSSSLVWNIGNYVAGYTDRDDLLGKVTAKNWGWTTGGTPYTGYNESNKSTGTDAAALIDEIPPNGSGTTDSDYYDVLDATSKRNQTSDLADSLLAAGDVAYGLIQKVWDRDVSASKVANSSAIIHDGTNVIAQGMVSYSGITSYAEHTLSGFSPIIWDTAPDGAEWSAKTNTYLDGLEAGVRSDTSSDTNATIRVSTIVMEAAIVLSGDTISNPDDPPSTRRIFIC